jgi:hypothetical protein
VSRIAPFASICSLQPSVTAPKSVSLRVVQLVRSIESAILCGLALLILGLAVYWVTRRAT